MPLISAGSAMTLVEAGPGSVALSMEVLGSDPPVFVRVLVTRECIGALDPQGSLGRRSALVVAQGDRMRIETAASAKFDKEGMDHLNSTLILGPHDYP